MGTVFADRFNFECARCLGEYSVNAAGHCARCDRECCSACRLFYLGIGDLCLDCAEKEGQ